MTTLYRIEVQICATAYVKADNEADAMAKVADMQRNLEVCEDELPPVGEAFRESELWVTGLPYDDARLPTVSLSPAMTVHGVWPGASLERAED